MRKELQYLSMEKEEEKKNQTYIYGNSDICLKFLDTYLVLRNRCSTNLDTVLLKMKQLSTPKPHQNLHRPENRI